MQINIKLYGQGGAIVVIDHIMQKTEGLVATGEVITGVLTGGDMVAFKKDDEDVMYDKAKTIQIDRKSVDSAEAGQLIGIGLDYLSKEDLINYFE